MQRKYLDIDLDTRRTTVETLSGEALVRTGRFLIARKLLDAGAATVDPLSPGNPLIFSAGPFAGTNMSNANRTSVGCRSPLTGGIKEANGGGTFGVALGHLGVSGMTLHGTAREWTIIHISKEGEVAFLPARDFMGRGNFATAAMLHEEFGNKVSLALCGPVGEYQGLLAGIAFSDTDRRPSRLAARGGVGAVMGSKRIKAVVVDLDRMPPLHDRRKVMGAVREYADKLNNNEIIASFREVGTAGMADFMNQTGGLPVRNFSSGRLVDTGIEPLKMGGDFIRTQNLARGGVQSHACMPGCVIQCSNVYADAEGNEIASPVEYETLGLMGSNCGLTDPDDLARLNQVANDIGIDSIEAGATLAVLMEAGLGQFGDVAFMEASLEEIRSGTDNGRLWAQGTARTGRHYGVARVPVIKQQAISAYDPRVVEVTGISMMVTAQGADHTTGNVPYMECRDKTMEELVEASLLAQIDTAGFDSLGLCIFGRAVSAPNINMLTDAINAAVGTALEPGFFRRMGRETLRMEAEFNRAAGFTSAEDELPDFFYDEPLPPTGKTARFHAGELRACIDAWWRNDNLA